MPGPPGQRFIPQVPFGLALGPQGKLAADVPVPPQQVPTPQPPIPGYVRQYAQGAGFQRRFRGQVITAEPVLTTPFVAPPGTFVGLGPAERIRRRRDLYSTLVAPPVLAAFIAPDATIVSSHVLRRSRRSFVTTLTAPPLVFTAPVARPATIAALGPADRPRRLRGVPPSTTLPAPVFLAPVARPAIISGLGAIARPRRLRGVPASTILPTPVFLAPVARYATIASIEAVERLRRRRAVGGTILPPPIVGAPVLPPALVFSQAIERPITRRTVPRPHLAGPLVNAPFFAPPATIVSVEAVQRSLRRGTSVRRVSRLQAPRLTSSPVVVSQAVKRSQTRRGAFRPALAPAVVTQTVTFVAPPALVVNQAIERGVARRGAPKPHLAAPVVGTTTFVAPAATIVGSHFLRRPRRSVPSTILPTGAPPQPPVAPGTFAADQALRRPYVGRTTPTPHLAESLVGTVAFRAPPALLVTDQSVARSYLRRVGVPAPHLAEPLVRSRFLAPAGTFVSQAVERSYKRVGVRTQTAAPVLGSPPVLASIVVSNVVFRAPGPPRAYLRVQKPRLAGPVVAPAGVFPPNAPGAFVEQSLRRPLISRSGHVRLPTSGAPRAVARPTYVYQAKRRALVGRTVPRPHLAGPVIATGPVVPPAVLVLQATDRAWTSRFRTVPPPHLAPPLVATATFLAPPPRVIGQSVERSRESRLRTVPRPHLANPVPFPAGPGATLKLQAVIGRALLGRGGRVRLPRLGAPAPVRRGTFVGQAERRPYVGRTVPRPHLAAPVVTAKTFPPNAPGTFVLQATARSSSLLSRRGRVRLAPPVRTAGRRPPTLVVSQALWRPYVGRKVIPPHLAKPVATKAGPGARLVYQAVQRPLTRRTIPLRARYALPLVRGPQAPLSAVAYVLSQAIQRPYLGRKVPPSPSLRYLPILFVPSQTGIPFAPITATGTVAPYRPGGTTNPTERSGATRPYSPGGATNPSSSPGRTAPRPHQP